MARFSIRRRGGVKATIDLATVSMAAFGTVALCLSFVHYRLDKDKIQKNSKTE